MTDTLMDTRENIICAIVTDTRGFDQSQQHYDALLACQSLLSSLVRRTFVWCCCILVDFVGYALALVKSEALIRCTCLGWERKGTAQCLLVLGYIWPKLFWRREMFVCVCVCVQL